MFESFHKGKLGTPHPSRSSSQTFKMSPPELDNGGAQYISSDSEDQDDEGSECPSESNDERDSNASSESEASAPDKTTHTLEDAIRDATTSRLRKVLLQMCQDSLLARDLATKAFLRGEGGQPSILSSGKKRKAYEVCCQCEKEYTVEENDGKSCFFHDGKYCTALLRITRR